MCTESMAVRPYVYEWTICSSTAVVVVYALHSMVFSVSPSECVGWYIQMGTATTAVHNLLC